MKIQIPVDEVVMFVVANIDISVDGHHCETEEGAEAGGEAHTSHNLTQDPAAVEPCVTFDCTCRPNNITRKKYNKSVIK